MIAQKACQPPVNSSIDHRALAQGYATACAPALFSSGISGQLRGTARSWCGWTIRPSSRRRRRRRRFCLWMRTTERQRSGLYMPVKAGKVGWVNSVDRHSQSRANVHADLRDARSWCGWTISHPSPTRTTNPGEAPPPENAASPPST